MKWYTVKDRWIEPQMQLPVKFFDSKGMLQRMMHADRVWISEDLTKVRFENHIGCQSETMELL